MEPDKKLEGPKEAFEELEEAHLAARYEGAVPWESFLARRAPGKEIFASEVYRVIYMEGRFLETPDLELNCDSDSCQGLRFFHHEQGNRLTYRLGNDWKNFLLTYQCRNCQQNEKAFAVSINAEKSGYGTVRKLGEWPPFGPCLSSKVISLIGPDREAFLKGRRAESQGMGIGAFAYYRRVVENQKGRLIGKIVEVAKRVDASEDAIDALRRAEDETQFSKAIDEIKDIIPETLKIGGHSPLKLLHSALSEGLHAQSDKECLEIAESIRVVLTDLAQRIDQALKDHAELKKAVGRLTRS